MWNFDKIQPTSLSLSYILSCGLMWNFDKIQLHPYLPFSSVSCGLMWNFDKIQPQIRENYTTMVVV